MCAGDKALKRWIQPDLETKETSILSRYQGSGGFYGNGRGGGSRDTGSLGVGRSVWRGLGAGGGEGALGAGVSQVGRGGLGSGGCQN